MIDTKDHQNILKDKYKIQIGQHKEDLTADAFQTNGLKQVNFEDQLQISIPIDDKNMNYPTNLASSPNYLQKALSKNEIDIQESNIHKNSKQNLLNDQFFSNNQTGSMSQRGLLNNASAISNSQPFSLNDNQLIQLDESSSEDDQTEIEKNFSRLKHFQESTNRDSIETNKEQKKKTSTIKIKPFAIMYQSLVFLAKLMRASSSFRFRNITLKQFGIIDDFSSDFEYYIYINHKIRSFRPSIIKKFLYKAQCKTVLIDQFNEFLKGKWILKPESLFRLIWDIFMIVFVLYLLIVIPIEHIYDSNQIQFLQYFNSAIIQWILVLELFVNFNTAVFHNGQVIIDRRKIFYLYHKNFIKDFIVMIMFMISRSVEKNSSTSYLDFFIFIKFIDIPWKLNDLENQFQVSQNKMRIFQLIQLELLVILIAHILSCIYLRIGLQSLQNGENNWISHFQLDGYSVGQLYLQTFYYMIITMTTIGYGDYFPTTPNEKVFITVVALIATNVCAFSFSQISEIVKYEQDKKQAYQQMMQGINKEMNNVGLNILLQHKVRKYYEFQHNQQNEDRQQNRLTLIENLPSQIKQEVLLDVNVDFLKQITFINQLSSDCKKQISLRVKQRIFYPEEVVFKEKEYNSSLFFISQGSVQLSITVKTKNESSDEIMSEMVIEQLKRKDVFGFEGFLYNSQNPYNAKCGGYSVITYIEREELMNILQQFPQDYEKYCFMKDEIVLSGKYKLINKKCYTCGDQNHSFRDCSKINPVFNWKEKYKVIHQRKNPERNNQFVRKTVSLLKAIKDQQEISKQALKIMAKYDEESMLSDLCSVLIEEEHDTDKNSQDEEDDLSVGSEQKDQENIKRKIRDYNEEEEDDNEDNEIQERNQNIYRKQKKNTYNGSESSDILDEEESWWLENQKDKRQSNKQRSKINLQDTISSLIKQINEEKIQKVQTSNQEQYNERQKTILQNTKFSRFRSGSGDNIFNSNLLEKPKLQMANQLDIIDENEEEINNMLNSDLRYQGSNKQTEATISEKQNKLVTINELVNEQLDESHSSHNQQVIQFESPDSLLDQESNVSIGMVQQLDCKPNPSQEFTPIHTMQQIKGDIQRKQSFQGIRSQNSNNFVSQNTLHALESDLNLSNNNYQNSPKLLLSHLQQKQIKNNNGFFSQNQKQYENDANNNVIILDSSDASQSLDLKSNHQKNQANQLVNQNGTDTYQDTNFSSKSTWVTGKINPKELIEKAEEYEDSCNDENVNSERYPQAPQKNSRSNNKTFTMSCNESQFQNVQENANEEINQNTINPVKVQDYDIYEKLQIKRKQKAQKTYLMHERSIGKKLTQKLNQNNQITNNTAHNDDILKSIQRTVSRKMSDKRKTVIQNNNLSNQNSIQNTYPYNILHTSSKNYLPESISPYSPKQQLGFNKNNVSHQQLSQEKQSPVIGSDRKIPSIPLLHLGMPRESSKKYTKFNISHYPSQIDPHLLENNQLGLQKHRRIGTIKATHVDVQKEADQVQSPRRNGRVGTRSSGGKTIISQSKQFERKGTNTNTNSSILGSNQLNQLNSSNIIENHLVAALPQNTAIEGSQESYEYMIRCLYNLQDLDMLIVRKVFLMEQQKCILQNYIFVEDNEMDIDISKEFKQYYPYQNVREIIKVLRKKHNKILKQFYPNIKTNYIKNQKQKRLKSGESKYNIRQNSKSSFNPSNQLNQLNSFQINNSNLVQLINQKQ
ncbi:hypothetical protein ABPG74_000719 [Tetrahymena malaccensis]